MTAVAINLMVNSLFSLITGIIIVGFFLRVFRVKDGLWKVTLLTFPFFKLIYDFFRGLPADSIVLQNVDPFSLPPRHQLLTIEGGFSWWGPILDFKFSVDDLLGRRWASSAGDYLAVWIERHLGQNVALILVVLVLSVSLLKFGLRVRQFVRFELRRRADRQSATSVGSEFSWGRSIDIYISSGFSGTPFTGGIFRPYVCIPSNAYLALDSKERMAVMRHELGHIHRWDLVLSLLTQLGGDLIWYLPGYKWLRLKIERLREIVADQFAIEAGAAPAHLAAALLKLQSLPPTTQQVGLRTTFHREESLLKLRVQWLIQPKPERSQRWMGGRLLVQLVLTIWLFMAVMLATIGGNHRTSSIHSPPWLESWLRSKGL